MRPGQIYRHSRWYKDQRAVWKPKYFVIMALPTGGDAVIRLLTSKPRPETPPCHHGAPYPAYFIGVPGDPLTVKSWIDLRGQPDLDAGALAVGIREGLIAHVCGLPDALLLGALECAASADDVSRAQERAMRDALAALR